MNIVLWIVAILLAISFAGAGITKLTQPKERLATKMHWVDDYSANGVKLIGLVELVGVLGLILPQATGIAKFLTPLAAVGLAIIMVLAAINHGRRGETKEITANAILFVLAVIVAVGRF